LTGVNRNEVRQKGAPAGAIDYDLKAVSNLESHGLNQPILRADVAGMPLEWVDYKEAARLYTMGQVAYACGSPLYRLHGGTNAMSGQRTVLQINSIIATIGHTANPGNTRHDYIPPLNNQTLFRRDGYICLYCAQRFPSSELSRDHIRPFSQGGLDRWTTWPPPAAAATTPRPRARLSRQRCSPSPCRSRPPTPRHLLMGRRVLADQMQYCWRISAQQSAA
jgi:5-methylcytosine-specific restriction endonuclease McrA